MNQPHKYQDSVSRSRKEFSSSFHKKSIISLSRSSTKVVNPAKEQWKNISTVVRSPSVVIGKSPKEIQPKSRLIIPGPGQYQLGKFQLHQNDINLGLSSGKLTRFNTENTADKRNKVDNVFLPSKKVSNTQCFQLNTSNLREYLISDLRPGPKFPKQTRQNLEKIYSKDKTSSPGPARYKNIDIRSSKNLYSFSKAKKFNEEEKEMSEKGSIPAPGIYNLTDSKKNLRGSKFTLAARMASDASKTPGPGTHASLNESSLSHKWGTIGRQRKESCYEKIVPGPGSYKDVDINKIKRKNSNVIIGKSSVDYTKSDNPKIGPGYYFKEKMILKEKIPGGTIDKSLREPSVVEKNPGPVDYAINFDVILSKSKQVIFGKERRYPQPKNYYFKPVKDSSLIDDLRASSNINRTQLNQNRQINRTNLSHY